ncbi:unnamed protein product [Rotaria sp. Silwood1]|nr:unnamed protein product [Rotaria sp. Silwood1]CAF0750844.1 unnamed protein product [Rotaria sp. Silwood1]CAF3349067.1 unnamed protein product [Rotaria sp. Silwood1]CAF4543003.1 unnamed protein product [Rotaria sp. Silwood1]CAF4710374.1 unnamed protein product [Rotaria sp. Silwood1]
MTEATTTNIVSTIDSTLITESETLSNSFAPFNIHKHESQIELNNYYINYIDDSLVQSESKTIEMNENLTSMSVSKENSCRLEVSQLPEEIFIDKNIQCEFECIFHEFDPAVIISYSNTFQQAYLTFSDPLLAFQVRANMNGKEFRNKKIQISYLLKNSSSIKYLKPPKQECIYMQSPPTTPPIGWVAKHEELPDINFDLFLALSKLQSNEPLEIFPKQNNLPAIIIHPCSDTSSDDDDLDDVINPIIDEFGHKKYQTIEAKRHAHILHDAILVPGEQHIKQSAGDGDKIVS